MRVRALLVLLFVSITVAAPGSERPKVVHLRDGSKVVGRIIEKECTEDVLVLRELRSRAKRKVPWANIKPELAQSLKVQLGFAVAGGDGLTIQGHRIINRAGTVFEGLITNPKTAKRDGYYKLKTSDGERRIRLSDVRTGPDPAELPAAQIYTPKQLYDLELEKRKPETAEDHYRLAELARLFGAHEEAKHHFEQVLAVDDKASPKYQSEKIQRQLEMVIKLLGSKAALAELREIKRSIVYRRYPKASERIKAFQEKYQGDDVLLKEATLLGEELTANRAKYYIGKIPTLVRKEVKELLLKKTKQKDLTLQQAQQYCLSEGQRQQFVKGARQGLDVSGKRSVSEEVMHRVGEELGLEGSEVLEFWKQRQRRSTHSAFYRDGTFIVIENLENALAKAPKIKVKKGAKKPKMPQPKKQKTPAKWWEDKIKMRRFSELRDWLYAWWAEKSGMCEVFDPREEICPSCHGKGYVSRIISGPKGSAPFFDRCQTCHMAMHFRVVRFR